MKDKEQVEESSKNYLSIFFWICLGILVVSIVYYFILNSNSENRGTFGDMFGSLNAVFSGFAFAGVIITIIMQMKELELTRKELRRSAEAQDKSQIALNEQLKSMQLTSKIDSLNQYISLLNPKDDKEKLYLANTIVKSATEALFYLKEHDNLTKPNIGFLRTTRITRPPLSKSGGIECEFQLYNYGADLVDFEIDLPSEVVFKGKTTEIIHQGTLHFTSEGKHYDFEIPMRYKGKIVQNKWKQVLIIKLVDKQIAISTTEPELIKRHDE